jgi:CheY-like chemotaxis protein
MVRILHADDNETDRFLVKRELGRVFADLQTREVRDQREFDAALDAGDFDLALTDYQLGWSDGLLVLRAVKARYPDRPVVMFTATGNEEVAVAAMKAGLDDYVVKSPQHAIRLVTAVRSALEKADARRRAAEAERERADLLRREQAARAQAERLLAEAREAERRKDEFLAMLAHELRNPLAPITTAVHLLRQPGLADGERERTQEMLQRQTRHLGRIVDDLLDVTRITRGRIELRKERVDLARLVRVAVRLEADPAGQAVLTVEDAGIGIEPALLPRLFEAFTQADRTLDRSRGGLGLGLALVKGLVQLHGGRAEAFSEGPGKGSRFTVRLPPEGGQAEPEVPKSLRILVIEDSRDGAESLRLLLELCGHEVRVAHTGAAGIQAAREFRPGVVLCDLGLPGGLSGYDVARALRQDPEAPARLIAVSGYGQPEHRDWAQAAGFDLHLTKPIDPAELQRRLASAPDPAAGP